MGLDMYLSKRTYIGNENRDKNEMLKVLYPKIQEKSWNKLVKGAIKTERISEIIESVAYWRKSNQIHDWFVQNVQNGTDDCEEYSVEREQLQELVDSCKKDIVYFNTLAYDLEDDNKIYQNVDISKIDLKPVQGFFFGSTEYDGWYVKDLENTVQQIEPLLKEEGEFYYQSSW